MARIRTVKPEFFANEELQDLEAANPGAYCMLVYAGLWGHCSKDGVFEFRPRTLKLSILPFLDYSMADTLALLEQAGFVRRFCVDGKEYGYIASFEKHQRISGKEAQFSPKMPQPPQVSNGEATGKQWGSNGEATGKQQGSNGENGCFAEGKNGKQQGKNSVKVDSQVESDNFRGEEKNFNENICLTGEAMGKHRGSTREAQEKEKEREKDKVKIQQQQRARDDLDDGPGGDFRPATAEEIFERVFFDNEEKIRGMFPQVDFELERAKCLANYRGRHPTVDPLLIVFKWFERSRAGVKNFRTGPAADQTVSRESRKRQETFDACREFVERRSHDQG